jgi:LDH2 family malate/lactate/ureidoglycolate dehydrogenase
MPGAERIYTAGEKEHLAWLERKNKGAQVDETLKNQIIALRERFNLNQYKFPFD